MRLPSGYGGVSKLPGNRRNPWRVRITTGWVIDQSTKKARQTYATVGYYPTRQAALQALADYNKNPYDLDANKATFAEVYNKWSEGKFKKISRSNVNGYRASFAAVPDLHDMKFTDIKLSHLQAAMDASGKNPPTKKKLKILFSQMFDYAVQNEIISKERNLVEYVDIGDTGEQSTMHTRFTREEVDTMWRWSMNEYVGVLLMLIYSGVRPGELFNLKSENVNLNEGYFTILKGKTANATRKVPIHNKTYKFFEHWMNKGTEYLVTNLKGKKINFENHKSYVNPYFIPLLKDMGILTYKNEKGELQDHLPDDTRHTFSTMWKEKSLDEAMRRKIQGHSGKGIGEIVYTHYDLQVLREELNKL